MGLITLNGLPKNSYNGKSYLYADLHLDLEKDYTNKQELFQKSEINDFKIDYDIRAIRNSLYNLFTTTPGEKILNPEFGLDLRKYLFAPATRVVAEQMRDEIFNKIYRFESRVSVQAVNITIFEDINEFDIELVVNIPTLNIIDIKIFGRLNNNGYTFTS
jgi:phage baseplate assembly protein W